MTISATQAEVEKLYLTAELNGYRSTCITACQSGDGVTSIASAFAERCMLAGHSTLYVDLNLFNPAFHDLDLVNLEQQGQLIEHKESKRLFVGVPAPREASTQLAFKDPTTLKSTVAKWLTQYDRVVIDTSPLLQVNKGNIPAQSVANACDSTLLVLAYGETTTSQLAQAKQLLATDGILLSGAIMNMKHAPSFTQELGRQLNRMKFIPQKWRTNLCNKLSQNEFLNLPI
ncbi:chromosome partitioning protein ParA [Vibrio sp. Isolate30]|uniref:chromosome partitioning protein ParA n=1 Tax=Vibrio sp. Isolate30 TaxID=2908536 RepID=UPI001EFE5949|nr:chromosome partitioning protein ParA [Vibrio sp. Isolate30]MCG9631080.1 chromosome partitioning protein ParA [Vibrio sp. Isolate30]